ncbi:hypothetical protein L7F22_032378 [Adiantum nelumboides]|nr:hypothetical protein [Adiantum nelumboides]
MKRDVWFHVDKLSSAHVYLRLQEGMAWDAIPKPLLDDMSQLVKANSIEGNKRDNQTIIYTPWSNIKKQGDMAVGAVSFKNDQRVRRHHVAQRENAIVNRLNKTRREEVVDTRPSPWLTEPDNPQKNAELAEARRRKEEKSARDYSNRKHGTGASPCKINETDRSVLPVYSEEAMEAAKRERERQARVKAQRLAEGLEEEEGEQSDDSFM